MKYNAPFPNVFTVKESRKQEQNVSLDQGQW